MILCFSEDADKLARLGEMLRAAGYHVFLCVDARDTLRVLSQQKVDVIIGDEALASEAGENLHRQGTAFYPAIPTILWVEQSPLFSVDFNPDAIVLQNQGIDGLKKAIASLMGEEEKFASGTS